MLNKQISQWNKVEPCCKSELAQAAQAAPAVKAQQLRLGRKMMRAKQRGRRSKTDAEPGNSEH